jgi:hypothetical protein
MFRSSALAISGSRNIKNMYWNVILIVKYKVEYVAVRKIKNWTVCVQDRGKWRDVEKAKTFNI